MMHVKRYLLLTLLLMTAGCQQDERTTPTVELGSEGTLVPVLTPTSTGATTVESSPTSTTEAQPTPQPALNDGLAPTLFDVAWDNREPFRGNLVESSQEVLDELPGATIYHLDVALHDDLTSLEGREEVRYTNQEDIALQEVYFRLFPELADGSSAFADAETEIQSVTVNGTTVTPEFELAESAMRVPFAQPLQPGESAVIKLDFTVTVPTEGGGNYGTFVFSRDVLALAHFYPMIAVYDDEGWNAEIPPESGDVVYADSSFYMVRVTAPRDVTLVASGTVIEELEEGEQQTVTFAAGPARDFYLAASEGYEVVSAQVGETTVNSYTFAELQDANENVLQYAVDAIETFEARIGPYPYSEFDLVSTPTLALGVEYPGIVAINMDLYDPEASRYPPVILESTVAHEVAHQWFYAVVGNDQLDDPWLDESLVQYVTMLYFQDVHGEQGAEEFRESLVRRWEAVQQAEIPIGLPVAAYQGPEYSAIVYGRGPLFFETLRETMGEESYDQFLKDYYQRHFWGIATPESLQNLAEEHCSCDLDALFADWVYGLKPDEQILESRSRRASYHQMLEV